MFIQRHSRGLAAAACISCLGFVAHAQNSSYSDLLVPPESVARVDSRLSKAKGPVEVFVRLKGGPLATALGPNAKRVGSRLTPAQQRAYLQNLVQQQNLIAAQIQGLGGQILARVNKLHNALAVRIDAARLSQVAALANVAAIRPVVDYQMALGSTVPYIGATALQNAGVDGTGVTVAVLDSGIDYTHFNLGGPGTVAAYLAAHGGTPTASANKTRDGLFPTAKVIEGYDFVGEAWPDSPRAPDPDPIDFEGHGTHVADIIAGRSADGTRKGVAPGAKLLAVKTCSAISTSCSGVGLLLGMDFAVDPNGDGALDDAADVINMSLGTIYGQREDDLSEAAHIATMLGIVVVTAAGNEGDKPYIVGSPSTTPAAISVAQTQVPGALGYPLVINAPPAIAGTYPNTATLDFAPVGTGFSNAQVVFVGRGCPAGSIDGTNPADPYLANPAGKVALVVRGSCNISLKVDRAADAGAIGVLVGLSAPGDAVGFAFGGGDNFVPSLVIQQSLSNAIQAQLAGGQTVLATLSPANAIPLAGSVISTSARGPGYSYHSIKPDIGAPGGSVSAEAGTGNGQTPFSGTSGAAPMVSGSAALLIQAFPLASPYDIKARLMNTAETNIALGPQTAPGQPAPITRIGAGEVRVNRARQTQTLISDAGDPAAVGLSLGQFRITGTSVLSKKVLVRNLSSSSRTYSIATEFRHANDAASGAVTVSAPQSITVPANASASFTLTLTVNAALLNTWTLNGGSRGGEGFRLQDHEYDGYVRVSDATDTVRLPWQLLAHKAANVRPAAMSVSLGGAPSGTLPLTNTGGAVAGPVSSFSLTGTSGRLPLAVLPRPGDNYAVIDLRAVGVRMIPDVNFGPPLGVQDLVEFAITTWGSRSHPNYPAEFDLYIDVNNDGTDDYVLFNVENGGPGATGQSVTVLEHLATGTQVVRFFTDADLDSANVVYRVLRSDLAGLTRNTRFTFAVYAFDNYYTGALTDALTDMQYTLSAPRFAAPDTTVPINGIVNLPIVRIPAGDTASPSQTGILLLYRDARSGFEADPITVTP
jgi:subtilisin family serine protease